MKSNNKKLNIVCISPAPWDYPIWTNRQHITSRLAEKHKVLYVFHPMFLRSAIKRNISFRRLRFISMFKEVSCSLCLYNPFVLPFGKAFLFIHRINIMISSFFLKRYLNKINFDEYILWFYDPEGVAYLDYLQPVLSCYDCVDEYSAMPEYNTQKKKNTLEKLERGLVERCDLVFTTSSNLYNKKRLLNERTFLVENVGDFDHFNKAQTDVLDIGEDIQCINSPIIGFIGAVDNYKVDFELIEYIALEKPDWNIVLIGARMNPNEKNITFPQQSNIHYLGEKEYTNLPNFMSTFDVCIIPYRINEYTKNVFPIKFFEFLATGKPVVSTALPALKKYETIAELVETHKAFLLAIEEALSNDSEDLKNKRINVAKANTWESRKDKLLAPVYEALEVRADENRN